MLDDPNIEAKPEGKGLECPTCGDRFPSQETLDEHTRDEHNLAGKSA